MFGDYPSSMRERVGDRLPKFFEDEKALIKGSLDFVSINHYILPMSAIVVSDFSMIHLETLTPQFNIGLKDGL